MSICSPGELIFNGNMHSFFQGNDNAEMIKAMVRYCHDRGDWHGVPELFIIQENLFSEKGCNINTGRVANAIRELIKQGIIVRKAKKLYFSREGKLFLFKHFGLQDNNKNNNGKRQPKPTKRKKMREHRV